LKIGSIVRVKADILSDRREFVGRSGRVIKIEPKCEGEYVTVLFDKNSGSGVLNIYREARSFCFSVGELEEHL
jgi:hypothetical protein